MAIINLKEWILADHKRIKKAILRGDKNRRLPKRALHIERILSVYASQDSNVYTLNIPKRNDTLCTPLTPSPSGSFFFRDFQLNSDWDYLPDNE